MCTGHAKQMDEMEEGKLLAIAIALTATAFENKTDRGGNPYILHCLYVMNEVSDLDECSRCAAVLHDIIEDTAWTAIDLRRSGFTEKTIRLVQLLTFKKDEDYMLRIKFLASDPDANRIKRADLKHNSQLYRLKGVRDGDLERMTKYVKAYHLLENH